MGHSCEQEKEIRAMERNGEDGWMGRGDLVNEILAMVIGEGLGGADDLMKVSVHELVHNVHIVKALTANRLHDVLDSNDVLVEQMAQEANFA